MFRKKWLASLLSLMMVFAFMPISSFAYAADGDVNVNEPAVTEAGVTEPTEATKADKGSAATDKVGAPQAKAAPQPVTSVSVSGENTVEKYSSITLSASLSPAGARCKSLEWVSSDSSTLTVNDSGKVTGVKEGEASVTAVVTNASGEKVYSDAHEITVSKSSSTDYAEFYYLLTPNSDPDSNSTSEWGPYIGSGQIDDSGWDQAKNLFVREQPERVLSWPEGYENGEVPKGSPTWNKILEKWKSKLPAGTKLDDVEKIILHPYKFSQWNYTQHHDRHVDCQVEIVTKAIHVATYYLWDVNDTRFMFEFYENVTDGNTTSPGGTVANLPPTKTVDGKTYKLYSWYTSSNLSQATKVADFPYTVTENVNFYAKYVDETEYPVSYDLNGGTWSKGDAYSERYLAGKSVQVVSEEPTREGYTFEGWGTNDVTVTSRIFTMPEKAVTFTAQWTENADVTINYIAKTGGTVDKPSESLAPVTGTPKGSTATANAGYEFDGWYTDSTCQTAVPAGWVDENNKLVPKKNGSVYEAATYYAKFKKRTDLSYTINYYKDSVADDNKIGDTVTVLNQTFGDKVSLDEIVINARQPIDYKPGKATPDEITIKVSGNNFDVVYAKIDAEIEIIIPDGDESTAPGADLNAKDGIWVYDGKTHGRVAQLNGKDAKSFELKYIVETGDKEHVINDGVPGVTNFTDGAVKIRVEAAPKADSGLNAKTRKATYTLEVIKRKVRIVSESDSKTYDGTALTKPVIKEITGDGFVEGEGGRISFTGSQTKVGSSKNVFTITAFDNTLPKNYNVEKVFGTLTVTEAPAPGPTPTPNPGPNGNGGGNGGNGGNVGVAVVGNANGGYTLTQIDNGKTPLGNGLLDDHCCILHLLIMLLAMIMLMWYTHDMKKRQSRIFELEEELEGYDE